MRSEENEMCASLSELVNPMQKLQEMYPNNCTHEKERPQGMRLAAMKPKIIIRSAGWRKPNSCRPEKPRHPSAENNTRDTTRYMRENGQPQGMRFAAMKPTKNNQMRVEGNKTNPAREFHIFRCANKRRGTKK